MKIIEKPLSNIQKTLSNSAMSQIKGGSMLCGNYKGDCGTFDNCGAYTGDCTKFDNCSFFKDK